MQALLMTLNTMIIITIISVVSRAPFHVKHAKLHWTSENTKIQKHMHITHLKQHVSKQSCSYIQLSSNLFVCWSFNVPATCKCISGTDLLRQVYVLPHRDRSCRPNFPSHPITIYWYRADQSQHWPYIARRLAGQPLECQFLSHWYDSCFTLLYFCLPLIPLGASREERDV